MNLNKVVNAWVTKEESKAHDRFFYKVMGRVDIYRDRQYRRSLNLFRGDVMFFRRLFKIVCNFCVILSISLENDAKFIVIYAIFM